MHIFVQFYPILLVLKDVKNFKKSNLRTFDNKPMNKQTQKNHVTEKLNIPAPSKICSYEVSSLLQKLFTNSSLTEGSNASTTKQASDNCWSKLVSSVSFPVPKLRQKQEIEKPSYTQDFLEPNHFHI